LQSKGHVVHNLAAPVHFDEPGRLEDTSARLHAPFVARGYNRSGSVSHDTGVFTCFAEYGRDVFTCRGNFSPNSLGEAD
jgi:hypothetical protein